MADKVLWENADAIDEQSLQEALHFGLGQFVVEGLDIDSGDVDTGSNTLDVPRGHAIITDASYTVPRSVHVFADARTGLPLASGSGDNYVYLVVDQANEDDVSYDVVSSSKTFTSPEIGLLIAVVNGGGGAVTRYNQNPALSVEAPWELTTETDTTLVDVSTAGTMDHNGNATDRAVPDRVTPSIRDPRK